MYDSKLDNQHSSMQKFAKRWFGPYVVTSTNDNATYHLAKLGGTRLGVPIEGKWVKVCKKTKRRSQTSMSSRKMKTMADKAQKVREMKDEYIQPLDVVIWWV